MLIANGSKSKGVRVQYRASLEQDLAAMDEFEPDLAIGTTPVVQKAKAHAIPCAVLHQSDLGAAAVRRRPAPARWRRSSMRRSPARRASTTMRDFFEGVGEGDSGRRLAGHADVERPEFREKFRKAVAAQAKKRKSEEMV